MHRRALRALVPAAALLLFPTPGPASPPAGARCAGRYAGSLDALAPGAREREKRPVPDHVFCLRAVAVYESVSYTRGGRLRRQYHAKVRHGTGFAYRAADGRVLVATNHHVVAFPEVTGEGEDVEGVPAGARLLRTEVRIVSSEAAPEDPAQPVLDPVLVADRLDLAVLAPPGPLPVLPYRLGRSADLRVGDAVLVHGFPLGAFAATNAGSVIGLGHRDVERGWDHEDFAVDALLNLGSSGSPVLAITCEGGEPELVGVYHAGYRGAQGLNAVLAVDGLRDALLHLRAPASAPARAVAVPVDLAAGRAALARGPVVFPFGGRTVRAERGQGGARFALLDPSYPLSEKIEVEVVDRGVEPAAGPARELREALWAQLALVVTWRAAEASGAAGEAARDRVAARIRDQRAAQDELVAALRVGAEGLERVPARGRERGAAAPSARLYEAPTGAPEVVLDRRTSREGGAGVNER